jgi:hypothetical protein
MPTPAVHLYVAQHILGRQLAGRLNGEAGDFLLGSVAPDAWSVGHITRRQAHILPIPIPAGLHGATELLALYPQLARAARLTPGQAAFVAGYMGHLLVDEIWYHRIFEPHFWLGGDADPPLERRLVCHNVLRLYHENQLQAQLEPALVDALAGSEPAYDFPLLSDAELRQWRDRLGTEMHPGAPKRSAEVFAKRLHVPVEHLLELLTDAAVFEAEILGRLPAGALEEVVDEGITQAAQLVQRYLDDED